jgi:hypothetical protein
VSCHRRGRRSAPSPSQPQGASARRGGARGYNSRVPRSSARSYRPAPPGTSTPASAPVPTRDAAARLHRKAETASRRSVAVIDPVHAER